MITHDPLHRSGRADFPHPAPTSGNNAQSFEGIRMANARRWQVLVGEPPHPFQQNTSFLATPVQSTVPKPFDPKSKKGQCWPIRRDTVITEKSANNRPQPHSHLWNGRVHAISEFTFYLIQLRLQSFTVCLPKYREHSIASLLRADMRESEKIKCFRLPSPALPMSSDFIGSELDQPRLLRVHFQTELFKTFFQLFPETFGIHPVLEAHNNVVGISDNDHIAIGLCPAPSMCPQIEYVVQINICQQWGCTSPLWRSFINSYSLPILQHASVQPFTDESYDLLVRNPVFDKLNQPFVANGIKESTNVQIEHPVYLFLQQSDVEGIQRIVLVASRSETIGETEKVRFVDSIHHFDRGLLDDLVFKSRYTKRSQPPISLWDVYSTDGLCSIRSALQPFGEVLNVLIQIFSKMSPSLTIYARGSRSFKTKKSLPKHFRFIDMVHERGKPYLLISSCYMTYPLQRTWHISPTLRSECVLLSQVPLGQPPSLHPLRRRLSGIVRELRRYYGSVRFPVSVHHWLVSLDFPIRSEKPFSRKDTGSPGSRAKCFSTCTGSLTARDSPTSCALNVGDVAFRQLLGRRRSGVNLFRSSISGLHLPLSTLRLCSREQTTHDSGSSWVANPSTYETFIHHTLPVLSRRTGATDQELRRGAS